MIAVEDAMPDFALTWMAFDFDFDTDSDFDSDTDLVVVAQQVEIGVVPVSSKLAVVYGPVVVVDVDRKRSWVVASQKYFPHLVVVFVAIVAVDDESWNIAVAVVAAADVVVVESIDNAPMEANSFLTLTLTLKDDS
jgi:hypothetical protein